MKWDVGDGDGDGDGDGEGNGDGNGDGDGGSDGDLICDEVISRGKKAGHRDSGH